MSTLASATDATSTFEIRVGCVMMEDSGFSPFSFFNFILLFS